ncbi:MAG: aromatic aminobenezylarsenical efflux permease ArsG family transporter [Desulfurivibrionaceae bacterium]
MDLFALPVISALWFGILTSISPCPLATNIAATTYIGKEIKSRYGTILAGTAYALGRILAYIFLTLIIVSGLFSIPGVSMFLQEQMNRILGPVLIIAGLFILDVVHLNLPGMRLSRNLTERLGSRGGIGAILLGFLFALTFCPISAALFFGSVIPLALKYQSGLVLPFSYGVGTALPVIGFALVLGHGSRLASRFVKGITVLEGYLRRLTAVVFIGIGGYFTLKYLLEVV